MLHVLLLGFTPSAIGLGLTIVPRMAVSYLWGYYPHVVISVTIAYQICQRPLSLKEGGEGLTLVGYAGQSFSAIQIVVHGRHSDFVLTHYRLL